MTATPANVRVAVTGNILVGATSAAAPTTPTSTTTGFTDLGGVDEKGLIPAVEKSSKDIKFWQNGALARTVITDAKKTYTFTLIETTEAAVEFAYATTVTATATHGSYAADPYATGGRKSFIFDYLDGANARREYWAEGEMISMNSSAYVNGEAVAYECTVVAYSIPQVFDVALKTP